MKTIFTILIVLFTFLNTDAQYRSAEKEKYDSLHRGGEFKPTPISTILSFSSFGIAIRKIKTFVPFKGIYHHSRAERKYFSHGMEATTYTDGIRDQDILKQGENDRLKTIIYKDFGLQRKGESGIWIALYFKKDNQWRRYYTG